MKEKKEGKKKKVAWGVTGSGEKLPETFTLLKELKETYENEIKIRVYLSKAGEQVTKWYRLYEPLKKSFDRVSVEFGPNSPFLAGELQLGKFEFLLIAPATSNTVAKIATGIGDTLLCNSAIMALKAFVPVYIMPSDLKEGNAVTKLPDGRNLNLRIRKEDAQNARKLDGMDGICTLNKPENIRDVFKKHFGPRKPQPKPLFP
jgi:archaeoflavoprotein AfpA